MAVLTNKKNKPIPYVGLGTFPLQGEEMIDTIKSAVKIGYRLIDTADDYRGEQSIGESIQELVSDGIITREDLFIQTKISDNTSFQDEPLRGVFFNNGSSFMNRHSVEDIVREKVYFSMRNLRTDYLDSLLIHLPYPGFLFKIWEAMIKLKEEGIVRYIGVSNFHNHHIKEICKSGVKPSINQIYICPIGTKQSQLDYNVSNDIQVMAYSPLMDLANNRIPVDRLQPIMKKYNKSAAQIVLRWNIDRNCLPLPKSRNPKRLSDNFDVFDFHLNEDEVNVISSLNYDYQYLVESKICPGL